MYEPMNEKKYCLAPFKRYPDAKFTNFTMSIGIEEQILNSIELFQTDYNDTRSNSFIVNYV
jgi:hypothetical protein